MPRGTVFNELGLTAHAMAQEQRLLAMLEQAPMCNRQLAAALGLSRSGAILYTTRMHAAVPKRLHVVGHHEPETGGYPRPIFAAGDGPDVAYVPKHVKMPRKGIKPGDRSARQREIILKALAVPMTAKKLAIAVHIDVKHMHKLYLRPLRDATPKQVFIKKWARPNGQGQWAPVYAAGDKKDAKKPPQETRAKRYAKERAKEGYIVRFNTKRSARRLADKTKSKPQSIFAALGL